MQTNRASLPVMSVQEKVDHPIMGGNGYRVGHDGYGRIPMVAGGTIYNYKVGDSYMDIIGDHIEPGVSPKNPVGKESNALQAFAYIGNGMKTIGDDVEGKEGYVIGRYGGVGHVMVYFNEEILELMTTGDKVLIRTCGQEPKLMDHEEVQLMNINPALFEGPGIVKEEQGIKTPVVTCAPAYLMGGGLGSTVTMLGDYDTMMQDAQANEKSGINEPYSGDLIMIQDHGNYNGPRYRRRAVSVGTVVYADSYASGRGFGLAVIMSSRCGSIEPILNPNVNIANRLHIR